MKKQMERKPASFASMLQSSSFFTQKCGFPECDQLIPRDEQFCDNHRCTFINEDGLRCMEIRDLTIPNSTKCEAHHLFAIKNEPDIDPETCPANESTEQQLPTDDITVSLNQLSSSQNKTLEIADSLVSELIQETVTQNVLIPLPRKFDSAIKKVTSFKIWPEAIDASDDILYDCKKLYGHKLEKSVQVTMGIYLVDYLARDPIIQEMVNKRLDGTESDLDFFQILWEEITERLNSSL